ncbi:MAG: FAD-dependent oxidoreductase [Gammaproteobacteria bacterium]|nr:FAD-dependent oxidoreductase [Gammaproteobacteria bacterium]
MKDIRTPLWTHLTSEPRKTGTWRSALPLYQNEASPCLDACPVSGRVAEWIKQVKDGDLRGAWETLSDNNPFPAIAGRICHHPCEIACNRRDHDETVGICSLERFVGDMALDQGWQFPLPTKERTQSIAVVGSGPAGLSGAYQLRRLGFQVSLYELKEELGGLMRYGIPSYRLARDVLDGEINRIIAMNVTLHTRHDVTDASGLRDLQSKHDAVFLATGASRPKPLPGLGYTQPWVVDSAIFLAATPNDQAQMTGAHVLVIGGGSAAMDVARSARRLGRKVTVLSLEAEGQLPAQEVEVVEAREESVLFVSGAMLQQAASADGVVEAGCTRVEFVPGGTPGSFSVAPIQGSDFTLMVDTIIPAIGQDADLDRWAQLLDPDGPVISTDGNWQTSRKGVFAGGDLASMTRFVTEAVGMGKDAAHAITATLDRDCAALTPPAQAFVGNDRINTAYQADHARSTQPVVPASTRLKSFDEVQQPLTQDQAHQEASRCFSCGTCIYCDNCYFYCPDMAITKLENGYSVDPDYCKGCGLCVAECPTGSIHMQEDELT